MMLLQAGQLGLYRKDSIQSRTAFESERLRRHLPKEYQV